MHKRVYIVLGHAPSNLGEVVGPAPFEALAKKGQACGTRFPNSLRESLNKSLNPSCNL
jgi:hypothetical protein